MKLIDADALFKSFESEENPEDSLWTLYGIKRKIEDAPRQEPCEDATLRDIFCMGCEYKEQELNTGHWIPVSERLPEDGRPVLIYAWNVHHVIARYDSFRTENGYKKCWVTADAWNGNTEIEHEVIAWMPLPEPYDPQESEDK